MELIKKNYDRIIKPDQSILSALKRMDELAAKSLLVSAGNSRLDGILSIGDIQRAIIAGIKLSVAVQKILRPNPS